jgi:hypothetical protein
MIKSRYLYRHNCRLIEQTSDTNMYSNVSTHIIPHVLDHFSSISTNFYLAVCTNHTVAATDEKLVEVELN